MSDKYKSFSFRLERKLGRIFIYNKIRYNKAFKNSDYVLLMSPVHGNLGDHAIVCAEQQIVNSLGRKMYDIPEIEMKKREKVFANFIPKDKTILIHGGGFLGSIWPEEEYEFRKILTEFSEHKIVVFPQTVTFDLSTDEGKAFFEESKNVYEQHKDLLIFVRDERSYKFMADNMSNVNCNLVPDVVTQYNYQAKNKERKDILLCMRNDHEKNIDDSLSKSILSLVKAKYPNDNVSYTDTVVDRFIYPEKREEELEMMFNQMSSARLVVTDRLHGMIFSAITNTPCIAFNNVNGKVGAQYRWIKENSYIKMVATVDEFEAALNELNTECEYKYANDYAREHMRPLFDILERNAR